MKKFNSTVYICTNCSKEFPKWSGQCPNCGEWNTLEESEILHEEQVLVNSNKKLIAKTLEEIDLKKLDRVGSGFDEFDRVLGGDGKKFGFIEGEVVLVSGDPGVGKSTLLLHSLINLASSGFKVLYVSAEESEAQVAERAKRIVGTDNWKDGPQKAMLQDNFKIVTAFNVDAVIATIDREKPSFVVIDSIQTVSTQDVRGIAGGIAQVKACTVKLVSYAKATKTTLMIVGHINKEGNVAGPKVLEHLVDAVLQIEGDSKSGYRIVRSLKNRFGTTNEVGILGMEGNGMIDIKDAAHFFVSQEDAAGVARSAILEGNRIIVIEVQALTNTTSFVQPKRVADGVSNAKLQVICAILSKHANIRLYDKDVYVNIAGGLHVKDPAVDLAVALAIISSVKDKKLPASTAVLGELSLTGGVNSATRIDLRKKELKRLGYSRVIDSSQIKNIRDALGLLR
jgi:DNA repair protein RadA/Sms